MSAEGFLFRSLADNRVGQGNKETRKCAHLFGFNLPCSPRGQSQPPARAPSARVRSGETMPNGTIELTIDSGSNSLIFNGSAPSQMNEPTPRMAKPPKAPSAQVATTNVANDLLGISLASPQNVMGPRPLR